MYTAEITNEFFTRWCILFVSGLHTDVRLDLFLSAGADFTSAVLQVTVKLQSAGALAAKSPLLLLSCDDACLCAAQCAVRRHVAQQYAIINVFRVYVLKCLWFLLLNTFKTLWLLSL